MRIDGKTSEERALALVNYVARCKPKDELYPKAAAPAYAARLCLNIDVPYALEKLNAAVESRISNYTPKENEKAGTTHILDPFDKEALIYTYFSGKEKIPTVTANKIKQYISLWGHKELKGYAKGAWNYFLMMDGAGFLAAEEWSDLVDADGLNAEEIQNITRKRLFHDFDVIVRQNHHEYGASIYLGVNLSAIRKLAEFSKDREMRKRASLALDAMLIDIACGWNNGMNVSPASRAKYWGSTDTGPDNLQSTMAAAWVYFGAPRPISSAGTGWIHSLWMALPGTYKLPQIICDVAQDRRQSFTYKSSVPCMGSNEVRRITYHSHSYALTSQHEQPVSPTNGIYKEARRLMLKWNSPFPSSTFSVCMENPRRPYALNENKPNTLGYGENAFSQYLQHEGTVMGLYAVPETVKSGSATYPYPYYKLYAPFPRSGSIVKRIEKSGWVFCHNGSMLMAFYCIKPYIWGKEPWNGNDLLWCNAKTNGWILETSEIMPFAGGGIDEELNKFSNAILKATHVDTSEIDTPTPRLRYKSLAGHELDQTWLPHGTPYKDQNKIDGQAIDYKSWPMHDHKFVKQEPNSPKLIIKHGEKTLIYDFENWTKIEAQ